MIKKVRKRDGRIVEFDTDRIEGAVTKAFESVNMPIMHIKQIVDEVLEDLEEKDPKEIPSVEDISDNIEKVLIERGYREVAKSFILYREYRRQIRELRKAVFGEDVKTKLSVNAIKVLEGRCLLRDETGKVVETPEMMFRRVANNISSAEANYASDKKTGKELVKQYSEEFFELMSSLKFLPNSPALMNAGASLQQLTACFVLPIEDSMNGIFDSLKAAALIHQSGGGCIVSGSKVFTTFCGLEDINVLYDKLLLETKNVEIDPSGAEILNLNDKKIKTISFDKQSNSFVPAKINKMWKFNSISEANKIITKSGTCVVTSSWHPFFVIDKNFCIVEKRADDIKQNDLLLKPDYDLPWLFNDYKMVDDIKVDENVAWLIGFSQGDGSLGNSKNGLRFRLFDGTTENLVFAQKVLYDKFGIDVSIQKDKRGLYSICSTTEELTNWIVKNGILPIGEKQELVIPKFILKSPKSVVCAFFAGLIDSDGYVDNRNSRTSISTTCKFFANQILHLCHLLGLRPYFRVRAPKGNAKKDCYEVTLSVSEDIDKIKSLFSLFLNSDLKKKRLLNVTTKKHTILERLPINFDYLENLLKEVGINTRCDTIHKKRILVNGKKFWLAKFKENQGISRQKLFDLLIAINTDKSKKLLNLVDKLDYVISSEKIIEKKPFFDFTVENYQNYLSGQDGFTVIHNTGFSFSRLRPRGDIVKSTAGVASGPVSFMKVFDAATEIIKQGGKRRGANMGVLRVDHPDIIEFITCKQQEGQIANFNISVAITDEFMKALEENAEYDLINPRTKEIVKRVSAKSIFDLIVTMAWNNGEPGVLFIDEINRKNQVPNMGTIESTNPCGEQALLPYESCNLGSINLAAVVEDGKILWDSLKKTTELGVRFLDDLIDMNKFPLEAIDKMSKSSRKIGLGVMGWADMLYLLKIPYNSDDAIYLADKVMKFIEDAAIEASAELAKERGSFPAFKGSLWEKMGHSCMRNAAITTVAPTGTLSMIADVSSGIEPFFSLVYTKTVLGGQDFVYVNNILEEELRKKGIYSDALIYKIKEEGTLQTISEIPDEIKRVFVVSGDVSPEWHIKMQAAFQKRVHSAVSKTINLPNDASIDDVSKGYKLAYSLGCKGLTVYRDGSRKIQVLTKGDKGKGQQTLEKKETTKQQTIIEKPKDECPVCKKKMVAKEGCVSCPSCGYSRCSA